MNVRMRLTGRTGIWMLVVLAALIAAPVLLDTPQVVALIKQLGLGINLPHAGTVWPWSGHLGYTVTSMGSGNMKKSLYASAGQQVTIHYSARFDNRQPFNFVVYRPYSLSEAVCRAAVKGDTADSTLQFTAPVSGFYKVVVYPWGFQGDFEIWWK